MSGTASAYTLLHPSVQYVVRAHLGWQGLRPVQEQTIPPILAGQTVVVIAPTAGGKTEAAILPLLSRVLDERLMPTSVLYVAPLKALLNDLGNRIGMVTAHLGLKTAVWHGDISQRERDRIASSPPDVLLTTPESLEVLLSLTSEVRRGLLDTVRSIVIDEVHLFYGSDRGTHVLALIERLASWTRNDLQRIALSATLGNPKDLACWFQGTSRRPVHVAQISTVNERQELFDVRFRDSKHAIASELRSFADEKVLAFCRTRSDVEEITALLVAAGIPAFPHHSALSRESRESSESSFSDAVRGILVATSTLELGIDIGDLDRVVQVDAMATVSAMLQRLGRSGRRVGRPARMTFLPSNPSQLVLAIALLTLHQKKWVEPLQPSWQPFPILVQQLLATVLQTGGLSRTELVARLSKNAAFSRIETSSIELQIDSLLAEEILTIADGTIGFGHAGERHFGFRSFARLASVFNTAASVTVTSAATDVGTLDRWFVDEMQERDRSTFLLGGRAWKVVSWPRDGTVLEAEPVSHATAPLYTGGGVVLGFKVMQTVRRVLAEESSSLHELPPHTALDEASHAVIDRARNLAQSQMLDREGTPITCESGNVRWYTYAGLRANRAIADALEMHDGRIVTCTNTSIRISDEHFQFEKFREKVKEWRAPLALAQALEHCRAPRVGSEVAFVRLLPQRLYELFARERVYDLGGAEAVLQSPPYLVATPLHSCDQAKNRNTYL